MSFQSMLVAPVQVIVVLMFVTVASPAVPVSGSSVLMPPPGPPVNVTLPCVLACLAEGAVVPLRNAAAPAYTG